MKTFILTFLLVLPLFAFSQQSDNSYEYCVLRIRNIPFSRTYTAEVDYGQSRRLLDEAPPIKDEKGSNMTFNSIAHVLNYMSERGWRVIQVFGAGYESSTQSDYRYLLEAKKGTTVAEAEK